MLFDVTYSEGEPRELQLIFSYACITEHLFSFNILARSSNWSEAEIEDLIDRAVGETSGLLNTDNMRISDENSFEACGY